MDNYDELDYSEELDNCLEDIKLKRELRAGRIGQVCTETMHTEARASLYRDTLADIRALPATPPAWDYDGRGLGN